MPSAFSLPVFVSSALTGSGAGELGVRLFANTRLSYSSAAKMYKTLIASLVIFSCSCVYAQEAEKLELSRRIVSLLNLERQFDAQIAACAAVPENSTLNPNFEFRRNPAHFGGVSPQSKYWSEVEAAYAKYRQTVCGYMTRSEFIEYSAKSYAERTTLEQLRAAVKFYESADGGAFLKANAAVGVAMQYELVARMRDASARADPIVRAELDRIADQYRNNSK